MQMAKSLETPKGSLTIRINNSISLLMALLIVYHAVSNGLNSFTNIFLPNIPYDTLLIYLILGIVTLISVSEIISQSYKLIIISLYVFVMLCLVSVMLYSDNQIYIISYLRNYFLLVFPYLIVGFVLYDYQNLFKYAKWLVPLAIISALVEYAITLSTTQMLSSDNMSFAYYILPSVIFALYFAFTNRTIFDVLLSIVGVLLVVAAGTRGPVLCVIFYIGLYLLLHFKSSRMIIATVTSTIGLTWFVLSEYLIVFLQRLNNVFIKLGLSTRILDYLLLGNYFDISVRDTYFNTVLDAIMSRPFIGYGVFGDRSILQYIGAAPEGTVGTYVHNIFIEFLCHYGIILGSLILFGLTYFLIKSYLIERNNLKGEAILIILPMAIFKLFMSNSYLQEPYFWLLLGMCLRTFCVYMKQESPKRLLIANGEIYK